MGRTSRRKLIKGKFFLDCSDIGDLLEVAIKQRNEINVNKITERSSEVLSDFAMEYLKLVCREVTEQPVCHPFYTTGISHVQVLQIESKKGYEWDRIYNMRDFEIVMHHKYPHAKVIFDDRMLGVALERARAGEVYMDEISEHSKKLIVGLDKEVFQPSWIKGRLVRKEVTEERIKACSACENNVNGICDGEVRTIDEKVKLKKAQCPLNKW